MVEVAEKAGSNRARGPLTPRRPNLGGDNTRRPERKVFKIVALVVWGANPSSFACISTMLPTQHIYTLTLLAAINGALRLTRRESRL